MIPGQCWRRRSPALRYPDDDVEEGEHVPRDPLLGSTLLTLVEATGRRRGAATARAFHRPGLELDPVDHQRHPQAGQGSGRSANACSNRPRPESAGRGRSPIATGAHDGGQVSFPPRRLVRP